MTTENRSSSLILTASSGGGNRTLCPEGNHPGILVAIVDLGTTAETNKDGRFRKVRKVALFWELPDEINSEGHPHILGKEYITYFDGQDNFGEKSGLRLLIEGWANKKFEKGQKFDLATLLGRKCLVNVIHDKTSKGKDVHMIGGITSVPKGMIVPEQTHEPIIYTIDQGPPPDLDWLPYLFGRKVEDVIFSSIEFGGPAGGANERTFQSIRPNDHRREDSWQDDDIPF